MWHSLRRELSIQRTVYAILGLLVLALWLPRFQGPIDPRWDGGAYYVLGTSLVEGKGYRLLNEPDEIQANQYPPLFPLWQPSKCWSVAGSWLSCCGSGSDIDSGSTSSLLFIATPKTVDPCRVSFVLWPHFVSLGIEGSAWVLGLSLHGTLPLQSSCARWGLRSSPWA